MYYIDSMIKEMIKKIMTELALIYLDRSNYRIITIDRQVRYTYIEGRSIQSNLKAW